MFAKTVVSLLFFLSYCSFVNASGTQYGQWSLLCGNEGRCLISQLVAKDPQGKEVVLGASVTSLGAQNLPVLILRLPSSVYQAAGVGIKVDDNQPIQVTFSRCDSTKCESVIKIDQTLMDELKTGKQATIAYALTKQHQMALPLSLIGFDEAYQALKKTL